MSEPRIFKSFNINKAYEKLLCEKHDLQAEKEALEELLNSQVKANCGIAAKLNESEESMDKLLNVALKIWVECTEVGNPALGTLAELMNAIHEAES